MLTHINALKVCKLLYIYAIIYYFFYLIKNNKKLRYFMICFICIQLNFQKLQTSAHTDADPDARLFSHLVKFPKRYVILILSKTHFRLFNLIFYILCQITPPPLFYLQNPNFASIFFLSD